MTYYLLDNPNPHAYGNFHGYTSRNAQVRLLVIHTTESAFDTVGPDTGAENVAGYLSRTERTASYHDIMDSDSHVPCLPHSYTAFGARGHNSHAIHMAFAGEASKWHTLTDAQVTARLEKLAAVARRACAEWDIPVRRLYGAAARADDARGVCGHADLDPTRRSDPGAGFPWDRFLRLLQEDDMALSAAEEKTVRAIHQSLVDAGSNGWFAGPAAQLVAALRTKQDGIEFADQLEEISEELDSNPYAFREMILHLRNHPTSGGVDVDAVIEAAAARAADVVRAELRQALT